MGREGLSHNAAAAAPVAGPWLAARAGPTLPRVKSARGALLEELRSQLHLALPVILVQVGLYAMGAVDAAFMGRVSEVEFGAVALGHSLSFSLLGFAMGTLAALDPIVAQAHGANETAAITRALQRGMVLALGLAAVVSIPLAWAEPILRALGQPSEVIPLASRFMRISIVGAPAFLFFVAQRQTLQATRRLRPLVWVILAANALNAALDWLLITGPFDLPTFGAAGCAWATATARWGLALGVIWIAGREHRARLWPPAPGLWSAAAFARMLHVGSPIGLSFGLFTARP